LARAGDAAGNPPFLTALDLVLIPSRAGDAERWAATAELNFYYEDIV
jgi:hypothetical protein